MELLIPKVVNINILTIIDADAVIDAYEANKHDKRTPQKIDLDTERMICAGTRGIVSGQGTAALNFKARHGDYISFRGMSATGNSDNAIIIYNIELVEGDSIFKSLTADVESIEGAVVPDNTTKNGLPPLYEDLSFSSFNSQIRRHGTALLAIQFGLYMLNDDGEKQQLYGYFEWDATITIS